MNNYVCFLITVLYGDSLIKCALKINRDRLGGDVAEFPMELENREILHGFLPLHVQSCGPIVDVSDDLFEIHEALTPETET